MLGREARRVTAAEGTMSTVTKGKLHTFEDFCFLVKDGEKADLIDGVIYMASPDNTDANLLFMWLGSLLHLFAQETEQGKVFGSRVAFRLAEHQSPEPDLAFVKEERLGRVYRGFVDGPPDLAI